MSSGMIEPQQSGGSQEEQGQQQKQQSPMAKSKLMQRLAAAGSNLPAFINELITQQAIMVAGTEAAAFLIEPAGNNEVRFKNIAHIRPDNSPPDVRQQALQAFAEIIKPCVERGQDGAIQIDNPNDFSEPQFCLVTMLRSEGSIAGV